MRKFFASLGAVALGASAVHAQTDGAAVLAGASAQNIDASKPWSVSCALRGFYDDNYLTAPKGHERGTFGISIIPSAIYSAQMDQTSISLRGTYGAAWNEDATRQNSGNNPWEQYVQFDAFLNHAFSERYSLDVRDTFVYAN